MEHVHMGSWANIVTKCLCLVFRSIFIPSGWLWGNWYFHSFFCGSAEGWGGNMNLKGVDKKAKIPPIKQRPTLRLWMNGKLIPKPVGYSPIWPEGSGIKEYGRNTKVLNKQMKCRVAGKIAGSKKKWLDFPKRQFDEDKDCDDDGASWCMVYGDHKYWAGPSSHESITRCLSPLVHYHGRRWWSEPRFGIFLNLSPIFFFGTPPNALFRMPPHSTPSFIQMQMGLH